MLPINPYERLSQNKISGQAIAWGRAQWGELQDGSMGYVFPEGAFQLAQTMNHLQDLGISLDDLMDCITQFETAYGSPQDLRSQFGLFKNSGETHPGMVVRSNTNNRVSCVMTPTSWEVKKVEAYFQWFVDDPAHFSQSDFERMAGVEPETPLAAPDVLPDYEEACHKLAHLEISEARKEAFLQRLWDLKKNVAPGYRDQVKAELMREWKTLRQVKKKLRLVR